MIKMIEELTKGYEKYNLQKETFKKRYNISHDRITINDVNKIENLALRETLLCDYFKIKVFYLK
jgi:hypothetical protein